MADEKARLMVDVTQKDATPKTPQKKGLANKHAICLAALLVSLCVLLAGGVVGGGGRGMLFCSSTTNLPKQQQHQHQHHPQYHHEEGRIVKRQSTSTANATSSTTPTTATASATSSVLVDFQVHQPVLTPDGATLDSGTSNGEAGDVTDSCQVVLMDYVFAYSYGEPYIGE